MKIHNIINPEPESFPKEGLGSVAPKNVGKLDMVIAFDTTGSMAAYIDEVRSQVLSLIPDLFADNKDLRLGIVAFGDYCDMPEAGKFGKAYQVIQPTDNMDALIDFVRRAENTAGGDGDEFYELVIKKITEETPWREGASRTVLLIADAEPHGIGYTYCNYVVNNQIDWRAEARKAADMGIKFDTVSVGYDKWFKELSRLTNGINVPFKSHGYTSQLIRASIWAQGSVETRIKFDKMMEECDDKEMKDVYISYCKRRNLTLELL